MSQYTLVLQHLSGSVWFHSPDLNYTSGPGIHKCKKVYKLCNMDTQLSTTQAVKEIDRRKISVLFIQNIILFG